MPPVHPRQKIGVPTLRNGHAHRLPDEDVRDEEDNLAERDLLEFVEERSDSVSPTRLSYMSAPRGATIKRGEGLDVPSWGGDTAFADLIDVRRGELLRVALFITGNIADAEDAVQDAVVSVAKSWSGVRPGAGYAYLRTAVVRKSLDTHRRPQSHELVDEPAEEAGFLRFDEDRQFFARLQALPPQQRAVLALRFYNGLDTRTIARLLEIGPSAVRSHLTRGLAALRTTTRGDA